MANPTFVDDFFKSALSSGTNGVFTLPRDARSILRDGLSVNPYDSFSYNPPEPFVENVKHLQTEIKQFVYGLSPLDSWRTNAANILAFLKDKHLVDDIQTKELIKCAREESSTAVQEAISLAVNSLSDDAIKTLIDSYDLKAKVNRDRSIRRFRGNFGAFNSAHSSSFVIGLAIIEKQHLADVNEYTAKVQSEQFTNNFTLFADSFKTSLDALIRAKLTDLESRNILFNQGVVAIDAAEARKSQAVLGQLEYQYQMEKNNFIAVREHKEAELDIREKRTLYYAKFMQEVLNNLAAPSGMRGNVPNPPNRAGTVLSAIVGGAVAGASIGGPAAPLLAAGVGVASGLAALLATKNQ